MKVHKYSGQEERDTLTALIVHDEVLGKIVQNLGQEKQPFRSKWSNLVAQWCFDYHARFKKAPGGMIEKIFAKFSEQQEDQTQVEIIEHYLSGLSRNYRGLAREINPAYTLDVAARLFGQIRFSRLAHDLETADERNDYKASQEIFGSFKPVQFGSDGWKDLFSGSLITDVLSSLDGKSRVIRFSGAMDAFIGAELKSTSFISLIAPEKRGKSFWLMEFVWQALRSRRKVLYYLFGDMSLEEVSLRFYSRICRRPPFAKTLRFPVSMEKETDREGHAVVRVGDEDRQFPGLTSGSIRAARERLSIRTASRQPRLKVRVQGGFAVTASQIESEIANLSSSEGWHPDIVVIDYADLLAPETNTIRMEYRHQVNESWAVLRRISLQQHCLVITATQAATSGYAAKILNKRDFSESKTKNAHVTGMLGLNQTPDEKEKCIYRLNWALIRDGKWSENQVLYTTGNLALACPCIRSLL